MSQMGHKTKQSAGLLLSKLFEKALSGDESAYCEFLQQMARIIRTFLSRAKGSNTALCSEEVEDLVQEVLMSIHKKRALYRTGMPILPWVKVITKHRLIDHIRAETRRPLLTELSEDIEDLMTDEVFETAVDIDKLLEVLDERSRSILKMAKIEELPHSAIASRTGMSLSAVKISVHRSLITLRKAIDGNPRD